MSLVFSLPVGIQGNGTILLSTTIGTPTGIALGIVLVFAPENFPDNISTVGKFSSSR